nr:zinc finger, CCHC-type [Tanacetum cinerariifolium]
MAGNTVKEMTTKFRKLDKFEGHDFRRWQNKMHFLLTMLKVVYVLTTAMPELLEDAIVEAIRIREKWENDDYICRGHILNGMSDSLFDVYTNVESAKELWDSLESKYMAEDSSNKKFLVDAIAWWIDSGATTPVCKYHFWFKTYESVEEGSVLYMGDDHFAPVHSKESVALEFSSGKTITLFNMLYVPKLRKNLVFGPMLNTYGYKQGYEFDKYILSKSSVFVRFGYYKNGMFMLNMNKVPDESDYVYTSSSIVVNSLLWHARLGHVHYKRMLKMYKDDLIHAIDENLEKYTTSPYTPQQNGVAKRKNRAIKEMVNSMLSDSCLSEEFWGEAMLTACYLLNKVSNKKNKTTTYEIWYKKQPNLLFLRVWGCRTVVRLPEPKRKTLGEKGIDCIFVGYAQYSKAYRPKDIIPKSVESQRDDHYDDVPSETHEPRKGCKWIFKRKMKVDETIDKFKARLVIQGFRQKEGIDYFDTYAPFGRITTIRLLLALVAIHNLVIHQMDVKTAFLNVI